MGDSYCVLCFERMKVLTTINITSHIIASPVASSALLLLTGADDCMLSPDTFQCLRSRLLLLTQCCCVRALSVACVGKKKGQGW
jgi:hypothetical protein